MERADWREKLKLLALQICERNDFELFDLEVITSGRRWLVRVTLDSLQKAVSINDCEAVSRELSSVLDAEDFIPHSYTLEVSSPGVERKLRNLKDFERFKGESAFVVYNALSEEEKEGCLTGLIFNVEGDSIEFEKENGVKSKVPFDKIKRAKLVFKFGK
jgi:ribosome maturation factor RimP